MNYPIINYYLLVSACVYNPAGLWTRPEMIVSETAVRILERMDTKVVVRLSYRAVQ